MMMSHPSTSARMELKRSYQGWQGCVHTGERRCRCCVVAGCQANHKQLKLRANARGYYKNVEMPWMTRRCSQEGVGIKLVDNMNKDGLFSKENDTTAGRKSVALRLVVPLDKMRSFLLMDADLLSRPNMPQNLSVV